MAITSSTTPTERSLAGAPGRFGDGRRRRIGLLGGSFNPAHPGHRAVAQALAARLRLDQVWLLVSPGNPLKPESGMAPYAARLASAARIAVPPRLCATGIEAKFGTRYAIDTVRVLRRRFPRCRFVWLMGADVWAELPRWRRWRDFVRLVPVAVHGRAGSDRAALAGQAARTLRRARRAGRTAPILADARAPAWLFLDLRRRPGSATALREAGLGLKPPPAEPEPADRQEPRHRPQAER